MADDGVWFGGHGEYFAHDVHTNFDGSARRHGIAREEATTFPGGVASRRAAFAPDGPYGAKAGVAELQKQIRHKLQSGDWAALFGELNVFEPRDLLQGGPGGGPNCAAVRLSLNNLNAARAPGAPKAERIVDGGDGWRIAVRQHGRYAEAKEEPVACGGGPGRRYPPQLCAAGPAAACLHPLHGLPQMG
eukprot:gene26797-6123_t